MAPRWHRVAYDVSVSDLEELEDVMTAHGWALDDEEPTVHARIVRAWFTPLDDEASLPGKPDLVEWLDEPEPEPDPDPVEEHGEYVRDLMFAQEVWDRLDDDGSRNPFAPPWGGGWVPGG
jgi:hypothetical protein